MFAVQHRTGDECSLNVERDKGDFDGKDSNVQNSIKGVFYRLYSFVQQLVETLQNFLNPTVWYRECMRCASRSAQVQ